MEEKPELCKECKYPLRKTKEEREGGHTEHIDYCDNCGTNYA